MCSHCCCLLPCDTTRALCISRNYCFHGSLVLIPLAWLLLWSYYSYVWSTQPKQKLLAISGFLLSNAEIWLMNRILGHLTHNTIKQWWGENTGMLSYSSFIYNAKKSMNGQTKKGIWTIASCCFICLPHAVTCCCRPGESCLWACLAKPSWSSTPHPLVILCTHEQQPETSLLTGLAAA